MKHLANFGVSELLTVKHFKRMKPDIQYILRSFALFMTWLIFPPIFLILSTIWKTPRKIWRLVLTFIAPLTLLILLLTMIWANDYYYWHYKRGSKKEIETLTSLKLPKYKVIEKRHFTYGPRFQGDFIMEYTIKLDTLNIKEFYNNIEEQIIILNSDNKRNTVPSWRITESGDYYYGSSGAPLDSHEMLELLFDKKNSTVKVEFGSW